MAQEKLPLATQVEVLQQQTEAHAKRLDIASNEVLSILRRLEACECELGINRTISTSVAYPTENTVDCVAKQERPF